MSDHTYKIANIEMVTPLVNAAGSINGISEENILREVDLLSRTSIGAITVGSFTVSKQLGNEEKYGSPVYFHDKKTGATFNSMGIPNIGIEAAVRLMPEILTIAHDKEKPVIASISPVENSIENGGHQFEQVTYMTEKLLNTEVDLIEINTSCPNIITEKGGRKPILGYDVEAFHTLLESLKDVITLTEAKIIGLKLPPYIKKDEIEVMPQIGEILRNNSNVYNFINVSNTIPNQKAVDKNGNQILSVPGGLGGMSGYYTRDVGRDQLKKWVSILGEDVDIISTLGVYSGSELAVRRLLGAAAAGGVTFLWESKDWGMAVTDMIHNWIAIEHI